MFEDDALVFIAGLPDVAINRACTFFEFLEDLVLTQRAGLERLSVLQLSAEWRHRLAAGSFGIEEIIAKVLDATGGPAPTRLHLEKAGKRDGFFGEDPNANSFLDEALTWRDVGYVWHLHRGKDTSSLEAALPRWALATLHLHAGDQREFVYDLAQWESAATHDPLWNAAQRELMVTGGIHNYLRMLWGKKIIEWSRTPDEAHAFMIAMHDKYAIDGRDPNTHAGVLWCFGKHDRPWFEREIFGTIRYMTSRSMAKKFNAKSYMTSFGDLSPLW
jgi:deoxyribodipyrimidine photo-lyase